MDKTYRIELTLDVPEKESDGGLGDDTIKEAVYAYLLDLIEDDSLYFEPVNRGNTAIKLLQTEF